MRFLILACAAGILAMASPAPGQETTTVVDSLSRHFRTTLDRAQRLAVEQTEKSGEDSLVVVYQLEAEVEAAARTLGELSSVLRQRNPGSAPSPQVQADFRALVDALWSAEGRVQQRLDQTRARLFDASGRERIQLESELADRERRLGRVHRYLQEILGAMAGLGTPADEDRQRLIAHLGTRAETLVGRIQLLDRQMEQIAEILESRPEDADFAQELDWLRRRSRLYIESLDGAVARLKALGQPTARFQNVLVTHTGEFARGLLDAEVAGSLFRTWWARAEEWLSDNGVQIVLKSLIFVIVMILSWGVSRVVRRAVRRALDDPRVRVSVLLRKMLIDVSGNLVLLAGFMLALSQVGANLGPVLAGVGVIGFIVGFALQETLANFAAGIMILFYRPYDVGDFVEVSGVFGKVDQMSLVSTTILTIDNQTLVVPNGKIWGDVIRNVTAQRIRRVDLEFGISYSDDIPKAERILAKILEDDQRVLPDPEPMVRLAKLNESSVDFIVRPWVKTEDYWDVFWAVTREVKLRFDAQGITIPFPQRDVHHFMESAQDVPFVPDSASAAPGARSGIGADAPSHEEDS
jgi:small conductance mechanosensitive channel